MKTVMTVQGPVNPDTFGFCQCHEHLALSKGVSFEIHAALRIDDEAKSTEEAVRLIKNGGSTMVDAQPGGCNRMEQMLLSISRASGLHIIASTGFHKLCFYPENHWIRNMSADELENVFYHELSVGMFQDIDVKDPDFSVDTSASPRAGIVKMALDRENLTPVYRKLFTAGAKAAIKADVPVMVHIEQDADPMELYRFLLEVGVSPKRMVFCHMDRAISDLSIHLELLKNGIFLEYDTIGRFKYHSDEREIEIFLEMLKNGYEDQLLFSLDTTSARLKSYDPTAVGLDYLQTTFVPMMKENGITEAQIRKISHDNFVRVFTE